METSTLRMGPQPNGDHDSRSLAALQTIGGQMLKKIRMLAFAVAVLASGLGTQVVRADDDELCSQSQGPCNSNSTPSGYCIMPGPAVCTQWSECTSFPVFCSSSGGGSGQLCWCDEHEPE
jgi:hypothetical protein